MTDSYILIIDDNLGIREAMSWVLGENGYKVLTATNGQEGLDCIEKNGFPARILLDLMMPIMNGFEFRARYSTMKKLLTIPTAIISARRKEEFKIKLLPHEIFLKKPFDLSSLLHFIKTGLSE